MKIIRRLSRSNLILIAVFIAGSLFATGQVQRAYATPSGQTAPEPELVATWQGTGGYGYQLFKPVGTLSLHVPASITWWDTTQHSGRSCVPATGENTDDGATIQTKGWWQSATPKLVEKNNCDALASSFHANVLRRGHQFYYFVDGQLSRKTMDAGVGIAATPLNNAPKLTQAHGAVLTLDDADHLVWVDTIDDTLLTPNDGQNVFYRMPADESEAAEVLFVHNNVAPVQKLQAVRYSFGNGYVDALVWLTETGDLYRYQRHVDPAQRVIKLSEYTADFAIHTVELKTGLRTAKILAAIHRPPQTKFFPHGDLLEIEPETGTLTALWPDADQPPEAEHHVISVATDSDGLSGSPKNIYISVVNYECTERSCTLQDGVQLFRRRLFPGSEAGSCIKTFCPILESESGGDMLASDDLWLYFRRGNLIYRIPTDAPPIERDFAATRLEVNQAIQNLKHDFALVARHPTVVRGYAQVVNDSTNSNAFQLTARLTGVLDGQPLAETLLPVDEVIVTNSDSLTDQRSTIDKTFIFELPEHWVRNKHGDFAGVADPSRLELEMVINPNNAPAETTYLNNDVNLSLEIFERETTCIVAVPMWTEAPIPELTQLPMAEILQNVHRFVPVSDIKLYYFHGPSYVDGNAENLWTLSDDGKRFHLSGLPTMDGDGSSGGGLIALASMAALSKSPCPGSTHWVGVIHEETDMDGFSGWGVTPGNVFMSKLWKDGRGSETFTHEFMHNVGREHTKCGDLPASQQKFDAVGLGNGALLGVPIQYHRCDLGPIDVSDPATYVGFDAVNLLVRDPDQFVDIMSYAEPDWVSMLNWYYLFHNPRLFPPTPFTAAAANQPLGDGDVLLVQGDIVPNQSVGSLSLVQRLSADAAPIEQLLESAVGAAQRAAATYAIRLVDASGATLQSTAVMTRAGSTHGDVAEPLSFIQYIPFVPQTKRVQLVENDQVLDERIASANAPAVELSKFTVDTDLERVSLAWDAHDADGDMLTAILFYSDDDGATWRVIAQGIRAAEADISTQNLAASNSARLRVMVSDGFHSATATSASFTVAEHSPLPVIDGIRNGEQIAFGTTEAAYGIAYDSDEGSLADDALTWSLQGPTTTLAKGRRFLVRDLAPGAYTLTLLATDSTGLLGQSSINFEILPVIVTDGEAPLFDGLCADSGYADAVRIRLPRTAQTNDEARWPEVRLLHADGTLYLCFTDQANGRRAAERLVGLQIDTDGSGGTSAQSGDIGFFIDGNGIATQTSAVLNSMAPTSLPSAKWDALVYPSEAGWSAELRIDETLIGGWEHAARLLIKHEVSDLFDDTLNWPSTGRHSQP
ncbi:MAG TPA: hypothetical protein P5121_28635, partial [Caldilineaceae bacterium]|nr:hypothetical protein [Caldilineaceae bacterium]